MLISSLAPGIIPSANHFKENNPSSGVISTAVGSNFVYTPVVGKPGNITSTLFPLNNTLVPGAQLPPSTLSTNPSTSSIAYDPVNQIAYVVNFGSSNITLVNVTTKKLAGSINTVSHPFAAIYDPVNGYIYVANSPNVSVIETQTNAVIKNITCGRLSTSGIQGTVSTLTLDTENNTVFVANANSHNLSVISGTTNTVVETFNFNSASSSPNGVAYDPANNSVYVVDQGLNLVYVLNATDYVQITNFSIPTSTDGGSIFYDPSSNTVLIGSLNYFTLLEINPALNNSMISVSTNGYPYDMVYDPTNNTMLVEFSSLNSILVLNSTNSMIGNITKYGFSQTLAYTGNKTQLLVTGDNDASAISILNASTDTYIANFIFYVVPSMAVYDSSNGYVYVTDSNSNFIYVIDPVANKTVGLIQTPENPGAIIYDSGNGMIFTGGSYITEINPSTSSVVQALYTGSDIVSMAYDSTNGYIYTSNFNTHSVSAYNPVSNSIVMSFTLPLFNPTGGTTEVSGIAYDPADQLIYVNSFAAQEIYVLTASSLQNENIVSISSYPTTATYNPAGQSVYVGSIASGPVTILKGLYSAGSIPSLGGGGGIAFNAKNNLMYVASTTQIGTYTYLYAVNAYTGTVVGEIPSKIFITDPVYASSSETMYAPDGTGDGLFLITGFAPTNYTVYFNETGLPSGTMWYVNVSTGASLSGTSNSVNFAVPNGTYYYTLQSANKLYGAASGEFNVTGSDKTISVNFNTSTYKVTFSQTTLPAGNTWWVNLSSGLSLSSNNGTITTYFVDGTYSYSLSSDNRSWTPSQSSGSINVNGSASTVNVSFSEVTYYVTFTPINLPSGDIMYVNLSSGMSLNVTSAYAVNANLPNGTYSYYAYSNDTRYSARPYSGSFTVAGYSQTVFVYFSEIFYNVTFTESGLTAGTSWYINITGLAASGPLTGPSYSVNLTNGSYTYIASCDNTSLKASGGSFTVSGHHYNISVQFSSKKYSVNFTESNLPSGTAWYVNLTKGLSLESTSATITTVLSPGTYTYSASTVNKSYAAQGGTVNVGASSNNFSVIFIPVTYNVTFDETGLPSGSVWYVNSSSTTSGPITSNSYTVFMMNGSYAFTVVTSNGNYVSQNPVVHVNVSGGSVTKSVIFTSTHNTVTFNGSGFIPGSTWYVNLSNGQKFSTTTHAITVSLAAGFYTYTVASGNKTVRPDPAKGNLTVSGSNITVSIVFSVVDYKVTFTETGLPSGITWTVYLNDGNFFNPPGQPVYLVNGTYRYSIKCSESYYISPIGSFTVNGQAINIAVKFTEPVYTVTFEETGLSPGTAWSVDFNGSIKSSTTSTITYSMYTGSYSYTFEQLNEYYMAGNANGSLYVSGGNITVTGNFLHYSYISVTVNPSNAGLYINGVLKSATNGVLNMTVKGGNYEIVVKDPGYQTYYKNFTLNPGQNENLTVVLKAVSTPSPASSFPLSMYEIIGIVAFAAIAISLAAVLRRRK